MKIAGKNAIKYILDPTPVPGLLLHGAPKDKIRYQYNQIKLKLVGNNAESEMRLTEIPAAELRKNKSLALDAIKALGFFPGPRLVLIENCSDGLTTLIEETILNRNEDDAFLIVTANVLSARSKLRKLFENNNNLISIGIYPEPPTIDELNLAIKKSGINTIDNNKDLIQLGQSMGLADFESVLEKISLYKMQDSSPVSADDILECSGYSLDIELNEIIDEICSGNTHQLGSKLKKLIAKGESPTSICIGTVKHFRNLHTLASNPVNMETSLSKIWPPVFGTKRNKLMSDSKKWGLRRIERAIQILLETDLRLRSSNLEPKNALVERALIRICMMTVT